MLQQAIHIFKKDVRCLRYEIAVMLAMVVSFTISDAINNHRNGFSEFLQILLPITWCYLIARSVHAEPIPGDRQFWITRPYNRASLLLAKLIFILTLINLPLLIAQGAILTIDGFPLLSNLAGLLWEQVVITTVITLPALVFAAMTANMIQFVAGVALLASLGVAALTGFRNLGALRWIAFTALAAIPLASGIAILWLQYSRRKTFTSIAVEVFSVLLGLGVTLIPLRSAFAIQSRFSGSLPGSLKAELEPRFSPESRGYQLPKGMTVIALPFRVTGLPEGSTLRCEGAEATIEAPLGAIRKVSTTFHAPFQVTAAGCLTRIPIDGTFLESHRDENVRIHGTLAVTVFGNPHSTDLPAERITPVPGVGLCQDLPGEGPRREEVREFLCSSALRWPRLLVTGHAVDRLRGESFGTDLSYSPFPAELMISPVDTRLGRVGADAIVITTEEPLAHVPVEFDAKDIRLGNLKVPTVR